MSRLALCARVALTVPFVLSISGCLIDPSDKPARDQFTFESPTTDISAQPPVDPFDYSADPVPTGLNADMMMLGGFLYERSDNWWNLRVKDAPVDPNSDAIIALIKSYDSTGGRLHPDCAPNFGIPYCVVDENTPLVPVTFAYASESDKGVPGGPIGYPIPAAAITDPAYLENGGSSDGDRHMLIFDKSQRVSFELAQATYSNGKWSASCGAVFPMLTNYRRPEGWTSADAAGLSVLAGLLRYDEVHSPFPIWHALRCSIRRTNGHVYPASHTGATDAGAPPLGMRLRLKRDVDISGYPPHIRKIFSAMKMYGLIVADRGGNMYVQGTMHPEWDNGVLNSAFHDLTIEDFEVIELGWDPNNPTN